MVENPEESELEVGLSHMVSHASHSFAYVKLSVDLLPSLEEFAAHGIIVSNESLSIDSLRKDVVKFKGIERLVNDYNNILGSTEAGRKIIFNDLIKFGNYVKENYDLMLVLAQFCGMIKSSSGSIDYSVYGSEVAPAAVKKVMDALRQQEIRKLRFWRGAIEEKDPVYKLLGGDVPIQEFRETIRKLKPELNGQSVVSLDAFKGDYELATVLNFKTAQEQNAYVVQVTDKNADQGSTRLNLYAVGKKNSAMRLPDGVFQDATLTQLAFYENEIARIKYIRTRDGF